MNAAPKALASADRSANFLHHRKFVLFWAALIRLKL
jgi:hypothetical protein